MPMILRDPRGFTLPEVLLTMVVIGIGLAAIMAVIPVGAYGVQEGKQLSTATFLADQKLEQIRTLRWAAAPAGALNPNALPANDCLGQSPPGGNSAPRVLPGPQGPTPCFDETDGTVRAGVGLAVPDPALPGRLLLADEDEFGTPATGIPGFAGYRRQVRIIDCAVVPGGCTPKVVNPPDPIVDPQMRFVTVTVIYTPLTGAGVSPARKSVTVTMVVAQR